MLCYTGSDKMTINFITFLFSISLLWLTFAVSSAENGVPDFKLPTPPPTQTYKAGNVQYDDGGLGPLYNLARSFINSAFPNGFPKQFVQDVSDGKVKIDVSILTKIKDLFLNFIITVGIGILFIILFPIIGCTFCCCRVVCGCCCERPQKEDPKSSCKKKVYGSILFVLVTFSFTGNICVFLSNERMTTAFDKIADTVNNNIDDLTTYMNSTIQQVEHIRDNFKATSDVISQELDPTKIAETLSKRAVSVLTSGTISKLQSDIDEANQIVTEIKNDAVTITTTMNKIITDNSFPGPNLAIDTSKLKLNNNPMDGVIQQLKNTLSSRTAGVTGQLTSAQTKITSLNTQINQGVDGMKNAVHNAQGFDIDNTKKQVHDFINSIKPYDKYRWYGGVGLASIILIVVSLQYFGIVFGVMGGCGNGSNPSEKGCVSNSGGRMLIASVALIFIFSSLLMLLTTILFIPGSMLERFVCQPLAEPENRVLDDVLQKFVDIQSIMKYNRPVSLSEILSSCQANKAAYTAFHLDDSALVTLKMSDVIEKVVNAKQSMDLSSLNSLSKPGLSVQLPTNSITQIQNQMTNSKTDTLEASISTARNRILTIKQLVENAMINPNPNLKNTKEKDLPLVETKLKKIENNIKTLNNLKDDILALIPKVTQNLKDAEKKLDDTVMKSITHGFVDRIFGIIDKFVAATNTSVYGDLGNCRPLWNLYDSIMLVSVCHYTIDSLNGVWFSIGWCILFFIPSIVFSVKFSNLIRDVDEFSLKSNKVGHLDDTNRGSESKAGSSSSLNRIRRNKVGYLEEKV